MIYQPGGRAHRLPLLGSAIVGIVLLGRSDTPELTEPPLDDPTAPDLARFSVVLDLPAPQLGSGRVEAARIATRGSPRQRVAGRRSEPARLPLVRLPETSLEAPELIAARPPERSAVAAAFAPTSAAVQVAPPVPSLAYDALEDTGLAVMPEQITRGVQAADAPEAAPGLAVGAAPQDLFPEPALRAPVLASASEWPASAPLADHPASAGPQVTVDPQPAAARPIAGPLSGAANLGDMDLAPALRPVPEPQEVQAAPGTLIGTTANIAQPARGGPAALVGTPLAGPEPAIAQSPAAEAAVVEMQAEPEPVMPSSRLAIAMPEQDFAMTRPSPGPTAAPATPIAPEPVRVVAPSVPEAPFPPGASPTFSYEDELILQIETTRARVSDTIIAYGTRSGVYLPFGAMVRFLDLAIAVSDDGYYASGWFLSEDRTIVIDLRQGTMTLNGNQSAIARGTAIAFDGELYLRSEEFASLLPLRVTTNLRAQAVKIETLEEFPFEQRIAREQERQRLASRNERDRGTNWPREETPWTAFSVPMTDVELRAATDSSQGARIEGDIRIAGDLAFMTARAYLSGSSRDGLTGARIELGRRDPDASLLGPLRATEFQLGDVASTSLPLGLRGISGRGAAITNSPIDRASLFDAVDLRGELPEGYEVELYRNEILIGSTRQAVNGQYEFVQVPVDFGLNVFRLVFYGPQGQRYQDVRRISVGDGRRRPGELVYAFGMAQKDVNVLDVRGPFDSRPPDLGAWRATGSLEYGVSAGLTAQIAGSWFETGTGTSWLATAGLRTGFGATAIRADAGFQKGGGKSAQIGVGGKLAGMTYSLTHAEYSGRFIDEVRATSSEFLDRASEVNLNATLKLGGDEQPFFLPLSGRLRHLEFASGRELTEMGVRASARHSGLLFSKTFDYSRRVSQSGAASNRLIGAFDLATLSGSKTQYRAGVAYEIEPNARLQSASVQVDHAFGPRTLASASLGHFFTNGDTRVGLSATQRFERFALSFNGDYSVPSKTYSATLRLGFGFGRNPMTGRFFIDRPGLASGGAAAIRAYHDRNADGRFDDGDLVLPEVKFGIGGQAAATGRDGVAMVSRLGDGNRANYRVDLKTLPDITLYPATEGVAFVPRAGRVHESDFAIVALSDIEGTAYFMAGENRRAVSGVNLELVDAQGRIAATTRTEGDGFYLFEQVRPGTYMLRLEAGQAGRLGLGMVNEEQVIASPDGDIVRKDIIITRP